MTNEVLTWFVMAAGTIKATREREGEEHGLMIYPQGPHQKWKTKSTIYVICRTICCVQCTQDQE